MSHTVFLISTSFALICDICLAVFIFISGKHRKINLLFSIFLLMYAIWILGDFVHYTPLIYLIDVTVFLRLISSIAVFIPTLFVHFSYELGNIKITRNRLFLLYGFSGLLSILMLGTSFGVAFAEAIPYKGEIILSIGWVYYVFIAQILLLFTYIHIVLYRVQKFALDSIRSQIRLFIKGSLIILSSLFFYFPYLIGYPVLRLDNLVLTCYFIFIALVITKHHLMDIRVIITRSMSYLIIGVMVGVILFLNIIFLKKFEFSNYFLILLSTLLLTTFFGDKCRAFLQTSLDKAFIKDQYNSDALMREISEDVLSLEDIETILHVAANHIDNHIHFNGLWAVFPNEIEGLAVQAYSFKKLGHPESAQKDLVFDKNSIEFDLIFGNKNRDEATIRNRYALPNNTVMIPMRSADQVFGCLFVGPKLSESQFFEKDYSFFTVIANHLVILFERIIRQKALQDLNKSLQYQVKMEVAKREKAKELVTKGIAHEIRNPIEAIRGTAENMKDYYICVPNESLLVDKEQLGESLFSELISSGYIDESGYPSKTKLLLGKQKVVLSEPHQNRISEVTALIRDKQRKALLLSSSEVIISESERVVRIADEMLKFGTSGKGLPKDCFSEIITGLPSEDIWFYLKQKGVLTASGFVSPDVVRDGFELSIEAPFNAYKSEIRSVLKQFKSAHLETVDVSGLVQRVYDVHHPYLATKGIVLHKPEGLINDVVIGREDELMRCLMNVLKNAEQSFEKGEGNKDIFLQVTSTKNGFVSIAIRDNGCGIANEHVEKVKEAFFTTKDPGGGKNVGLGLAFVTRIVEGFGGILQIQSVVGQGTEVCMLLCPDQKCKIPSE